MSAPLPAPAFTTHVPSAALDEIHEKIKTGTFGKVLQDYTNGEIKLSMWIPSDLAGRVIGKKGMVITNLQRETKARVINALPRVGDSLWIAVVIIGDFKTVFDACRAITDIVENEVDEVVLEFTINYRKPFFIYGGKKYAIVRKISADTNVRIFFPEFNPKEQSFKEALPMTLEGNSEDVRTAVTLLEREALIYQHQQAHKAERNADKNDKDGASVATAESKEVKSGRRNVLSTHPDTSSAPVTSEDTNNKRENTQDVRNSKLRKEKGEIVERVSSKIATVDSAVQASKVSETSEKSSTERKAVQDSTVVTPVSKEVREPLVKVEKIINIPTSLVGLLLSKRPKAKNTTINLIQLMTHTVISKMPPAGMKPGSVESAENQVGEVVEAETTDNATETKEVLQSGESSAGRRRRAVSEEEGGAQEDEGSESESDSNSDSGSESESEAEEGSDSEDSSDEAGFVDAATTEPAVSATDANTTTAAAESVVEGEVNVETVGSVVEDSTKSGVSEERKVLKKRMIAESEKVGFVSFRVVGQQENVDMVVEALESIIKGDRIMEVTEQLKISSRGLKSYSLRPARKVREPRDRDDPTRPERKERSERHERRLDPAAEEAARLKYGAAYDPDRVRSVRSKRKESDGEPAVLVDGVSSKYKGKTPLTKEERDARRALQDAAREAKRSEAAASGVDPSTAADKPKRVSKGPPRLPTDERPRSAKSPYVKSPKTTTPPAATAAITSTA